MCAIDGGACQVVVPVMQSIFPALMQSGLLYVKQSWAAFRAFERQVRGIKAPKCRHRGGLITRVGGGVGWIVCADCDATLLTSAELPDSWDAIKGRVGL